MVPGVAYGFAWRESRRTNLWKLEFSSAGHSADGAEAKGILGSLLLRRVLLYLRFSSSLRK